MNAIDPAPVRSILIRANNWIGDVVMIAPAVRAIRERFAGARIAIVARPWVVRTLRGNPYYDDLIEYDSGGRHHGARGVLRLARELRPARYDLAILFQKAFEAAALAFLAGARMRAGYPTDGRRFLLTHAVPLPPPETHHAEAFLGIARALGCVIRDPRPFFFLAPETRRRAAAILDFARLPAGRPLVALHPGASKPPRAWHAHRFARLGRTLIEQAGGSIILIGGREDRALLAEIARHIPARSLFTLPDDLAVEETAAVLERCRLFVGNDSGPMHIAAALGVPVVGIFGPGSPRRTAPIAAAGLLEIVGKDYPCAPCRQDFFRECPPSPAGKPFCLEEISVDEVIRPALRLLSLPLPRAPGAGRSPESSR